MVEKIETMDNLLNLVHNNAAYDALKAQNTYDKERFEHLCRQMKDLINVFNALKEDLKPVPSDAVEAELVQK